MTIRFPSRRGASAARLRVWLALLLALATLHAPLLGGLHLPELHLASAHGHDLPDLHAAGCDHDGRPDHHHAEGCVVCRVLLQVRGDADYDGPAQLDAARRAWGLATAAETSPGSSIASVAAPRAPPFSA